MIVAAAFVADQRSLHLEHDIGVAQRRRLVRRDRGSRLGKRGIAEPGAFAGAALHDDFETHAHHALDGIRRRRHPALERPPFLNNGDFHRVAVPERHGRKATPHNAAQAAVCEE